MQRGVRPGVAGKIIWCGVWGNWHQERWDPDKEPRNFGSIINTVYCEGFFFSDIK